MHSFHQSSQSFCSAVDCYQSEHVHFVVQVGSASDMISQYEEALTRFEEDENVNEENVSIRYEKVCRVV